MSENMPEYGLLFELDGTIDVEVKKVGHGSLPVRTLAMGVKDIDRLIRLDRTGFISKISVDEFPYLVDRYEIRPMTNKLIIWVVDTTVEGTEDRQLRQSKADEIHSIPEELVDELENSAVDHLHYDHGDER